MAFSRAAEMHKIIFERVLSFLPGWFPGMLASWITIGTTLIGLVLYRNQNKMLYHPELPDIGRDPATNPEKYRSPMEWEMPHDAVTVTVDDGTKLQGWFIKQPDPKSAATIIFFHENAGNLGLRLPSMFKLWSLLDVNIFMVSYRGYGTSTGTPDEAGLKADSSAVIRYVAGRPDVDAKRILLLGRSLGGAVAIHAAERHPDLVKALIVENTFTSIPDMVDALMPVICWFKSLVLRIEWRSIDVIPQLTCPILFVSGQKDELVPPAHMQALYDAADKSIHKAWYPVREGMHNDTWMKEGDEYVNRLRQFMQKIGAL
eukprot:CAMPEP_0177695300 /NCGR_PEP_ID=MMETSP0484_2-20121128/3383_1 /TAXON_ID=354590 /ORGANISM="Rhodomonas lens, Strain RHODO" /LENGTH=315 /DNA_ID=CAMNT_0019206215 /DNA_START=115 /DNA_END=1062 /DNA_ORIENTATION=-